ncbi:hypothetical protein SPRG_00291 [Saprolegnia parasitica CBS 223.65]|uniref:Diaminopimelate decarboxylase n=1 Tax=Saprolegnia parasitica (strain CBS 223.65) TaxID=695850 RepID=A0A067CY50_SAPPC|nr:hypothetical protein SPRG_00291 [Saprolegnia parasitica CBS 223.65]KDO35443.1 hypothetical protein SPRG_00291 [Saprolegnia parasitica CBS 223.65]|eukprot:XP_012193783.1 hypothetical protein SPRG_00291 [Saprolegnia parasitica CBS 223.65]
MDALRTIDLAGMRKSVRGPEARAPAAVAREVCQRLGLDPTRTLHDLLVEYLEHEPPKASAVATPIEADDVHQDEVARHEARAAGVASIVQRVVQHGYVDATNPVVDLFDMEMFLGRLHELRDAFPPFWTHALAIKANPLAGILRHAQPLGFGLETASYAEAMHALRLGFSPDKIIIDSPCKTASELDAVLSLGCYVNLDNVAEIEHVDRLLREKTTTTAAPKIGLRINPVVGGGTIAASSTATATSKFGLIWTPETSDRLLSLYKAHHWLQGVHVHVGSQGCALALLVAGAKRAVAFASFINDALGRRQIDVIDIGGGVPTSYDGLKAEPVAYATYASLLRADVPELFSGEYRVISEFGRSVFAKPGVTLSRVEAVKDWQGHKVAILHCGANQFLRSVYLPTTWPMVYSVFAGDGSIKHNVPFVAQDLAGPLCFSGDVVARQVRLPQVAAGDYVVLHDTGAYTMAMYSKFNSIPAPATLAYTPTSVAIVKARESLDATLAFWGSASEELQWRPCS